MTPKTTSMCCSHISGSAETQSAARISSPAMRAIVARIPSAEVREIVFERLARLNRTLRERMYARSRLGVLTMPPGRQQLRW